ncbi:hypothetical protein PROFUN_10822 [Planoprotostelium fungivorum]|uniref:Uncharacterized protein n=1 Tax=Planoprotostelium fungivorum TaxID=1890364 RepID=A0A2P6NCR0_9EUKA|nr:hypothetical protein PROFUN_10822 [Planoprotostelium fungivorum]
MPEIERITQLLEQSINNNKLVLAIFLQDNVSNRDVMEFIFTQQKTGSNLKSVQRLYLACKAELQNTISYRIWQRSIEKLDTCLDEYLKTLQDLQSRGQLDRTLGNTLLRRKLEQLNSAVALEAVSIDHKMSYLLKEQELEKLCLQRTTSQNTPPTPRKSEELKTLIDDSDARLMWENSVGNQMVADWSAFIKALSEDIGVITPDQQKVLRRILDNSNTGVVSAYKFGEFLKGFGPLNQCIQNLSHLLIQPWFHGFLSGEETKRFLESQPAGTFLVRFSSSKPGSFALGLAQRGGKVNHVMIRSTPEGFVMLESGQETLFASLDDIVAYYAPVLTSPFSSEILGASWFFGEMDANEADNLLRGQPSGTYVIRFSSQKGYLAGSYVDPEGQVAKCLICTSPQYYLMDDKSKAFRFDTMGELMKHWSSMFQKPYKKTRNEVNNRVRHRIATEIFETEKTYAKILKAVATKFLKPLQTTNASLTTPEELDKIFSNIELLNDLHASIVEELTVVFDNWNEDSMLGKIFVQHESDFHRYQSYINNYDTAIKSFSQASPDLKNFVDSVLYAPDSDHKEISFYLIQPVQRIPRYILLLTDLLKYTPASHDDYEFIEAALNSVKRVTDIINEGKRISDNNLKIGEMNQNISGTLNLKSLLERRKYFFEGDLMDRMKKKERRVYLLNGLLVITQKKKDGKYEYLSHFNLSRQTPIVDVPDMKNDENTFKIISASAPDEPLAWFQSRSIADKENWIQAYQDMMNYEDKLQRSLLRKGETGHRDSIDLGSSMKKTRDALKVQKIIQPAWRSGPRLIVETRRRITLRTDFRIVKRHTNRQQIDTAHITIMSHQSLPSSWNNMAANYEKTAAGATLHVARIMSGQIPDGAKILDNGCGTGLFIESMEGRGVDITATDFSQGMIDIIRGKMEQRHWSNVKCQIEDAQSLSFSDEHFSHVILNMVIQMIPDPVKAVSEAHRVLQPGGVAMIGNWKFSGMARLLGQMYSEAGAGDNKFSKFGWSQEKSEEVAGQGGFQQIKTESLEFDVPLDGYDDAVIQHVAKNFANPASLDADTMSRFTQSVVDTLTHMRDTKIPLPFHAYLLHCTK